MSTPLKHALVDHPEPAYIVAQQLGISEPYFSKLVRGLREPSEHEKNRLPQILDRSVAELFSRTEKETVHA